MQNIISFGFGPFYFGGPDMVFAVSATLIFGALIAFIVAPIFFYRDKESGVESKQHAQSKGEGAYSLLTRDGARYCDHCHTPMELKEFPEPGYKVVFVCPNTGVCPKAVDL